MRARSALTAAAVSFAALGIVACGGDDSTIQSISTTAAETTSTSVTTDEFITAADARCAEANAAIANLSSGTAPSTTSVDQQLSITKETLSYLKGLGSPEDPDGSLADFYSALGDQVSVLKQQEQALTSGDTAAADALDTQLGQAESDAADAASAFCFEDCGQDGSSLPGDSTGVTTTPGTSAGTPAPTTTPSAPVTPAPVTPAPPTGGTGGGTGTGGTGGTGGGGGSNSGGIAP
jgi:trimeric autotransporter adhesin